jgi:hypothetical protein
MAGRAQQRQFFLPEELARTFFDHQARKHHETNTQHYEKDDIEDRFF